MSTYLVSPASSRFCRLSGTALLENCAASTTIDWQVEKGFVIRLGCLNRRTHMSLLVGPQKGTLALVGAGEYLPGMEDVDRFLLKRTPGEPLVVCMPTAAGKEGSERIAFWSKLGTDHFSRLGARVEAVEVVDRDTAMDTSLSRRISLANFVYLSGGDPHYLHRTLAGTRAYESIIGVLEKGGVVAGCSAGAMIWGERIPKLLPPPWPWRHGFNKIPGITIIPHFDQIPAWFMRVFRVVNFNRPTMVGIDGYTALILTNGTSIVRGQGGVVIWGKQGKMRFGNSQIIG